eukprot:GHUV01020264.1.p1 GENE.GHUV01020264.1~~GHUV01020264.1.p1  ORF type:complete len:193 (+),score=84.00 GHUV01020264.1:1231-1809(+)
MAAEICCSSIGDDITCHKSAARSSCYNTSFAAAAAAAAGNKCVQDWRAHRRTCELAAGPRAPDRMPKTAPPLWSADKYADRFGLQRPKLRTSKGSSSAASTGRSTPPAAAAAASEGSRAAGSGGDGADATDGHGSRLAKNQRKRAKKKEKKAVAAAAAGHAEADDAGHRDQAAAGGEAVEQLAGDVAGVQLE